MAVKLRRSLDRLKSSGGDTAGLERFCIGIELEQARLVTLRSFEALLLNADPAKVDAAALTKLQLLNRELQASIVHAGELVRHLGLSVFSNQALVMGDDHPEEAAGEGEGHHG